MKAFLEYITQDLYKVKKLEYYYHQSSISDSYVYTISEENFIIRLISNKQKPAFYFYYLLGVPLRQCLFRFL